ncbi:MAG TPA: hypothetical protein VII93_06985 [Anaerolineales bacterium]
MTTGNFLGFPTHVLENRFLRLETLTGGARIVHLSYKGGPSLFAELSKEIDTEYGTFRFLGGHRLWHSPESMPRTYLPDLSVAQVDELPDGIRITCPPEPGAGIVKAIDVRLDPHQAFVHVHHELRNEGFWMVECAPWALTMFRLGGTVILPQTSGNVDAGGLLPNRQLVLWPYTKINDLRLDLNDDFILLRGNPDLPPVRIGYFNSLGWIAYWIDGVLFVKRFDPKPGAPHPDGGCNAETYCSDEFVELETLGPLTRLDPGKSIVHDETWELYDSLDQPFIPTDLQKRVVKGTLG